MLQKAIFLIYEAGYSLCVWAEQGKATINQDYQSLVWIAHQKIRDLLQIFS